MTAVSLLTQADAAVFSVERAFGASPFVIACDHAGRSIPRALGRLGLSERDLATHVACDLGAAELARGLAERLDAVAILHGYSRLVIDPNRPPGAPDSIPILSERTAIAANEGLSAAVVRQRLDELFHPYHQRLRDELDARRDRPTPSILVALHTFTPVYLDESRRWHAGVLYGRDPRLGRLVLEGLRRDPSLVVGDNQPYAVSDATDYTIVVHGERRGIPHVELEIRQDLVATPAGIEQWAGRLGEVLEAAASQLLPPVRTFRAPSGSIRTAP